MDVRQSMLSINSKSVVAAACCSTEIQNLLKQELYKTIIKQFKVQLSPQLADAIGQQRLLEKRDFKKPTSYLRGLKSLMTQPEKMLHIQQCKIETDKFGVLASDLGLEIERHLAINELCMFGQEPELIQLFSVPLSELT